MTSLTVSYGLISPQSPDKKNAHILPVSRILHPKLTDDYYLTTSRDGSIVLHPSNHDETPTRFQIHSDWVSDIIEINQHSYITTSHDFSIVHVNLFKNSVGDWLSSIKIIGNHKDYIKCISYIPRHDLFVTGSLDCTLKIWKISYLFGNPDPSFELYHIFKTGIGSIYTLTTLRQNNDSNNNFDLIAGDCNGDLWFYSAIAKKEIKRIKGAHETNIKVIKLIDDESKLISTCSNGIVHIWDINNIEQLNRIKSWKWNCSIWCIDGNVSNNLLVGDSLGNINKFDFTDLNNIIVKSIFNSKDYFLKYEPLFDDNKHLGILDLKLLNDSNIYFSYCSDSNLNCLNLKQNTLSIEKGGFALTRSSLLTNRRHVITENTQGKIQRWDIVSCELINTFPRNEGTFDEIVVKYTSKEILSHWCTVTVKVGMLFVKIGPKFSNTELYGSALQEYFVVNDVKLNSDDRYNIGKIVVNSLFNDFMEYEQRKDEDFRKALVNKKKDHDEKNNSNNIITTTTTITNNINEMSSTPKYSSNNGGSITPKTKEKFMKMSGFGKLGSSISIGNSNKNNETPFVSAPTTPLDKEKQLFSNENNITTHQPPKTAPAAVTGEANNNNNNSKDENFNQEIVNPVPVLSKNSSGRAQSSGSLLSRKFKSFRLTKNDSNVSSSDSKQVTSDEEEKLVDQANLSIDTDIPEEKTIWNKNYDPSSGMKGESPFNNSKPSDYQNPLYMKLADESKMKSRAHSTSTLNLPSTVSNATTPVRTEKRQQFMADLITEFHNAYVDQYTSNLTSLKLLTRKMPDTLIKRDPTSPVVKIRLATLIVVHSWEEDVSGGSVLSSSILPPSSKRRHTSSDNSSSSSLVSSQSDNQDPLAAKKTMKKGGLNNNDNHDYYNDFTTTTGPEAGDDEFHMTSSKKDLFEHLERDLPYWFAKKLCKDIRMVDDQQPKLNFVLQPWLNAEQEARQALLDPDETVKTEQKHYMLKFGKSKGTGMTDLPKISDMNARLTAPGMIKVKKIKFYVIDRFEAKTAEMKAKTDPSEWLEILCKGQVLDNDMTLSTVRTLYWKSQGEIILNYRRKVDGSVLTMNKDN
ncbi:similar to Saccharomyces cerevisiae YOL087C Putative protein of unknown function [Maudiozyma saulgeensis]|uniref:Uncharacterized protein n=1 Tax=Maudiozyma saulgeensis TaxID=1789683 RepID=A0A1X7R8S8_9SACH|nr:similar to Saccharomyces cerevisiae YOL087C Putative protein of unknown function [Kazachstania saulgeensis]